MWEVRNHDSQTISVWASRDAAEAAARVYRTDRSMPWSHYWTRAVDPVSDDMSTVMRTPDTCSGVIWPAG